MIICQYCFTSVHTGNFCSNCGKSLLKQNYYYQRDVPKPRPFVPPKINICPYCNSNKIQYWQMSSDWNCQNCCKSFRHPNEINPSDRGKYRVLSKEEVNPRMISICNKCYSDNITTCQRDGSYCKNCGSWPKVIRIKESQRAQYPIKTRDEVNPRMISICKFCHSNQVHSSGPQWDITKFCSNCSWSCCQTMLIKESEYNSTKFPVSIKKYPNN